jgi:hypothetical protein
LPARCLCVYIPGSEILSNNTPNSKGFDSRATKKISIQLELVKVNKSYVYLRFAQM